VTAEAPGDVATGPVRVFAPASDVDLWLASLVRTADEIAEMTRSLSAAETARAARFGHPDLRNRYVVGRATLRMLLGQRLDIAPDAVVIQRGERGRPFTAQAEGLDFNLSHTRSVALFGITHGQRIGVDIEHGERSINVEGITRKFMSPRERSGLDALAADDRRRALLRLWTCKEAMSKATGDALSAPFRRMDVETVAQLRLAEGPPPYTPEHWRLLPVAVPGGFLATVALWQRH
jgi:4'-phosphopantetheinyl transferase